VQNARRAKFNPNQIHMKDKVVPVLIGVVLGYMLSPLLDRVPFVKSLPKLG
jgi:hypothetical protein